MNKDLIRSLILSDIVYNERKYKTNRIIKNIDFYILCNKWKDKIESNDNLISIDDTYITYTLEEGILYISVAGTITNKQLINYLFGFFEKIDEINEYIRGEYYFHKIFLSYFRKIKDKFFEIVNNNKHKKLVISGHSVGGSIAILGALLSKLRNPLVKVDFYSFGSPTGCNEELKLLIINTLDKCENYVCEKDFIPRLTPNWLFKTPGRIIKLKENEDYKDNDKSIYYYHKTKVYYRLIKKLLESNK